MSDYLASAAVALIVAVFIVAAVLYGAHCEAVSLGTAC